MEHTSQGENAPVYFENPNPPPVYSPFGESYVDSVKAFHLALGEDIPSQFLENTHGPYLSFGSGDDHKYDQFILGVEEKARFVIMSALRECLGVMRKWHIASYERPLLFKDGVNDDIQIRLRRYLASSRSDPWSEDLDSYGALFADPCAKDAFLYLGFGHNLLDWLQGSATAMLELSESFRYLFGNFVPADVRDSFKEIGAQQPSSLSVSTDVRKIETAIDLLRWHIKEFRMQLKPCKSQVYAHENELPVISGFLDEDSLPESIKVEDENLERERANSKQPYLWYQRREKVMYLDYENTDKRIREKMRPNPEGDVAAALREFMVPETMFKESEDAQKVRVADENSLKNGGGLHKLEITLPLR